MVIFKLSGIIFKLFIQNYKNFLLCSNPNTDLSGEIAYPKILVIKTKMIHKKILMFMTF